MHFEGPDAHLFASTKPLSCESGDSGSQHWLDQTQVVASTKPLSCESGDSTTARHCAPTQTRFNEAALLRERRPYCWATGLIELSNASTKPLSCESGDTFGVGLQGPPSLASTKPLSCESGDRRHRAPHRPCGQGFNEAALLRERRLHPMHSIRSGTRRFNEAALLRERRPCVGSLAPAPTQGFNEAALLRERRLHPCGNGCDGQGSASTKPLSCESGDGFCWTSRSRRRRSFNEAALLRERRRPMQKTLQGSVVVASTKPLSCESGDVHVVVPVDRPLHSFNEAALLRERRRDEGRPPLPGWTASTKPLSCESGDPRDFYGPSRLHLASTKPLSCESGDIMSAVGSIVTAGMLQRSRSLARAETDCLLDSRDLLQGFNEAALLRERRRRSWLLVLLPVCWASTKPLSCESGDWLVAYAANQLP